MLDSLSPSDDAYESVNIAISNAREPAQQLRDEVVSLQSQRATVSSSIDVCKEELKQYEQTPRTSTSVHVARAQSEQSNSSLDTGATSKKSKAKK